MALAGQSALGKPGGLPGGGGKVGVAPAALSAAAEDIRLIAGHVLDNLVGFRVPDQGAPRDPDGKGFAVLTAFALAHAVRALLRRVFALVAEIHEGGEVVVHLQNDVAAGNAVAAVRTACGDVFFPVEGDAAIAAVASPDGNPCFVNECRCHCCFLSFAENDCWLVLYPIFSKKARISSDLPAQGTVDRDGKA